MELNLEPIGRNKKSDPRTELFSFKNTRSPKTSSPSTRRASAKSKAGPSKIKDALTSNPSGTKLGSRSCSTAVSPSPIGRKREIDSKAGLFNFGPSNKKKTSKSLSSQDSQSRNSDSSSSSTNAVVSRTNEDSRIKAVKQRRSNRIKPLSIYTSTDESGEENDVFSPSPAKTRKLSDGKNNRKRKITNSINSSGDSGKLKKSAESKKRSADSDDHDDDENVDDDNLNPPNQSPRTSPITKNDSGSPPSGDDDSENDSDSVEVEVLKFVIDEAQSDYMKLRNSDLTNNVLVVPENCTKGVAGFMSLEFTASQTEEYPGVIGVQNSLSDSVGVGYMKIKGNTIRPPEMSTGGRMIFWVLRGSTKVKSAGVHYPKNDFGKVTNYLYGKKLDQGNCIVVSRMTPFTFENWDSSDAVLGFCIVKETDE